MPKEVGENPRSEKGLPILRGPTKWQLQVLRFKAGVLGDAGKHPGPDFLRVMERPGEFTPGRVVKLNVRGPLLGLDGPVLSEKGTEDFASFCTRPVAQG